MMTTSLVALPYLDPDVVREDVRVALLLVEEVSQSVPQLGPAVGTLQLVWSLFNHDLLLRAICGIVNAWSGAVRPMES